MMGLSAIVDVFNRPFLVNSLLVCGLRRAVLSLVVMVWWQYVVVAAVAFRAPSDHRRGLLHDMRFSAWWEVN